MAKNSSKIVYAVALVLFLGGLSYLIFSGLTQDSVYFLNVTEALAQDRAEIGNARLFGKVSPRGLSIADGKLGADFDLVDKVDHDKTLRVEYKGALPDTFKADVEVIVEGKFSPDGRVFVARTLVTKCPSKYEEKSKQMDAQQGQAG
ncbi:cytochrome c-type biogenesis protein CcmE [Pseudodesulfovibrio mercurii]|uniref:Cytochrome c-type biogenesis protein CcmE n=1 Tax=Pseudodesulfovibrio mercurii TaxID=641491 RepID=F0JKQ7_9BACT|nr:cytochrome c maturation protein CcmE [Pseudodesulfovibrio mercurii]EGB16506.1 cytochrome c-type biogenesis protein CcmE [Pseudodesulfovibrio mercurii]